MPSKSRATPGQTRLHPEQFQSFSVVRTIRNAWATLANNSGLFLILAVIGAAPMGLTLVFMNDSVSGLVVIIAGTLSLTFVQGAAAYAVYRSRQGNKPRFTEVVKRSGQRFRHIIIVTVITSAAMVVVYKVASLIADQFLSVFPNSFAVAVIALMFHVVPAMLLYCQYIFALPVCVTENLGPIKTLIRSFLLTNGIMWNILALTIIIFCLIGLWIAAYISHIFITDDNHIIYTMIAALVSFLILLASLPLPATAYYEALLVKGYVERNEMTHVFD